MTEVAPAWARIGCMTYGNRLLTFARESVHAIDVDSGFERLRRRTFADKNPDAIFIHVPKTAGTSLEHSIEQAKGLVEGNPKRIGKRFTNSGLASFRHNSIPALMRLGLVDPGFVDRSFKFSLVRNPYSRFVSLWRHFQRGHRWLVDVRVEAFAELLAAEQLPRVELDYEPGLWFYGPQTTWLFDEGGRAVADYVGRFENLDLAFAEIQSRISVLKELPHLNKSVTADEYRKHLSSHETRQIIERLYRSDLETWSYVL